MNSHYFQTYPDKCKSRIDFLYLYSQIVQRRFDRHHILSLLWMVSYWFYIHSYTYWYSKNYHYSFELRIYLHGHYTDKKWICIDPTWMRFYHWIRYMFLSNHPWWRHFDNIRLYQFQRMNCLYRPLLSTFDY